MPKNSDGGVEFGAPKLLGAAIGVLTCLEIQLQEALEVPPEKGDTWRNFKPGKMIGAILTIQLQGPMPDNLMLGQQIIVVVSGQTV